MSEANGKDQSQAGGPPVSLELGVNSQVLYHQYVHTNNIVYVLISVILVPIPIYRESILWEVFLLVNLCLCTLTSMRGILPGTSLTQTQITMGPISGTKR